MNNYFEFEELCITGEDLPISVATKLLQYHITPMNVVRRVFGVPITASLKSGYRPVSWELSHDRNGNSQHTFKDKGAVDWTCKGFVFRKSKFLEYIIKYTKYTRMAIYDGFIHCDYKATHSGKREIYKSTPNSKWTLIKIV